MQLNINIVKEKAKQLDIPLVNLLAGSLLELCVRRIATSTYGEVMWLENGDILGAKQYKKGYNLTLCYSYIEDEHRNDPDKPSGKFDEETKKLLVEVLCPTLETEDITWKSKIRENELLITATLGEMAVPLVVRITPRIRGDFYPQQRELRLLMENNMTIEYMHFPYEWTLAHHYVNLMEKMELLPETEYYIEMYDIVSRETVDGRKVREYLLAQLEGRSIAREESRLEIIKGYANLRYMKAKWKVLLRQKKRTEPSLEDALEVISSFFGPLWHSICTNEVFFGDWMPQLRRYL